MPDRTGTPVVIGLIVGAVTIAWGGLYRGLFDRGPGWDVGEIVVVVIVGVLLAMLAAVVLSRIREIKKEDPDDYRKY